MKILVIGSEGFIGGFMVKMLQGKGHTVTGMDIRRAEGRKETYTFISGDLMDAEGLKKAMAGMDLVLNLAAKHHDFGISREEFFEINEEGTRRIVQAMTETGIKKFIFYSSVAVYGDVEECSNESLPEAPSNDYGESKLAAEKVIRQWAAQDPGREVIMIRPTVVFGPHNYANMYKLINAIYKGTFVLVGKGDNIKSVTYVENLVDMTGFVLERLKPGVEVYNYSDYEHLTSAQIIDIICRALGRKKFRRRLPLAPVLWVTSVMDLLAKITRINFPITAKRIKKLNTRTWHGSDKVRALGFEQKIPLEEGFRRMVEWYLEEKGKK